jgi:hypothetical protein
LKNPADFACRKSLEKLDKDSEKDKEIAIIARKILKKAFEKLKIQRILLVAKALKNLIKTAKKTKK